MTPEERRWLEEAKERRGIVYTPNPSARAPVNTALCAGGCGSEVHHNGVRCWRCKSLAGAVTLPASRRTCTRCGLVKECGEGVRWCLDCIEKKAEQVRARARELGYQCSCADPDAKKVRGMCKNCYERTYRTRAKKKNRAA